MPEKKGHPPKRKEQAPMGKGKPERKKGGMAMRGVTRPMAEKEIRQGGEQEAGGDAHEQQHEHRGHDMSHEERLEILRMHYKQTLWVYWTILLLGVWLIFAPSTFGYAKDVVAPGGGRSIWLSTNARVLVATWNDVVCGLLLLIFGWRSLTPNRPISLWACCFVGIWLSAAPLLFWAPTPAAYLNDTVVGALLIALTVLIPGMPNMIMYMRMGGDNPPGWSYNPSSWPQRWVMIVLGLAGWVVSRYLAAFQLGFIDTIWDPFFGDSTRTVLNSDMSHMWPVSDGALGAFSYTFEFLMGYMGSPARWRTMPWMVTFFGILVIPLGLTHIFLVISQPVVVGHWCTFCLLAAGIMLPMIPLEVDEVVAMIQHVIKARRKGESFWSVFWKGGTPEGSTQDKRSPGLMTLPQHPWRVFKASLWGMSFPWMLVVATAVGIWLMFSPTVFGIETPASHIDHLAGALIVTVSVISMGEVVRQGRYLNVLLGLIVVVVPWFLSGGSVLSHINGAVAGLIVIALSIPRGKITEKFGPWDAYIV